MALSSGTRVGPYEIVAPLGAGGMGEVYRARDHRLSRDVALKVLPESVSADPETRSRFEREARLLASLNHPHIAAIYGLEVEHEVPAIVLELVDGASLGRRLDRVRGTGLPLAEAVAIALQITKALEAAHDRHVIHRDLKPANIHLTDNGTVKVLDFGLARLMTDTPQVAASDLTRSALITEPGVVLGTAAYMSPEQAIGAAVDHRTDIFSFGCVLFELLSGHRAFDGDTAAAIRARVMSEEPPWQKLPHNLPPRLREILELCLAKDLTRRRQSISDVRIDLERAEHVAATSPKRPARTFVPWAVAAMAAAGVVATLIWPPATAPTPGLPEMRLEITTTPTVAPHELALSPDGQTLVYAASSEGGPARLWLHSLRSGRARTLGTGGSFPFWSPDGRSIAFIADGALRRLDVTSGTQQTLASTRIGRGGSWNADDVIVFAVQGSPIQRVSASGSDVQAVTRLEAGHTAHLFPAFLPDGRHFLYFVAGDDSVQGVYLGALDGSAATRLALSDSAAAVLPPDRIIYNRQGVIVSRRLDLATAALTGPTETLIESSPINPYSALGASASARGEIAYRAWSEPRLLRWFDRSGVSLGVLGDSDADGLRLPRFSPDGRWIALDRAPLGNRDLWIRDLTTGSVGRFTTDRALEGTPVWSPDAKRLAFSSDRNGSYDIYVKDMSGTVPEVALIEGPGLQLPLDWSSDGRYLLFYDETGGGDVRALPLTGNDRTPLSIANSAFAEPDAVLSPDARLVAYTSNESGRFEIYVQPFPHASARWQVSANGGICPQWSRDGRELYFIAPDAKLMSVPVARSSLIPAFGGPAVLFQTRIVNSSIAMNRAEFDVTADGRFLINEAHDPAQAPIQIILNWKPK